MYPNEPIYMPNDSVNIEKHIKKNLLNTGAFNVNPGKQGSAVIFSLRKYFFCHKGVKQVEWKEIAFNTMRRQLSTSKYPSAENGLHACGK
jgi:hypothetical protein